MLYKGYRTYTEVFDILYCIFWLKGLDDCSLAMITLHDKGIYIAVLLDKSEVIVLPVYLIFSEAFDDNM